MNEQIKAINEWSASFGLDQARPDLQVMKIYEELGELSAGVLKFDKFAIKDGMGDVFISMMVLARQLNIDMSIHGEIIVPSKYETYETVSDLILDELYPSVMSLSQHVQLLRQRDLFDEIETKQAIKLYMSDIVMILQYMSTQLGFSFSDVIDETIDIVTNRTHERVFGKTNTIEVNL